MSKRAEEAAMTAYPPIATIPKMFTENGMLYDPNTVMREVFIKGYEQAEKDIISLIESRIGEILGDAQPAPVLRAELRDLIKRIKDGTE